MNCGKIKSAPRMEIQNNSYPRSKGQYYNSLLGKDGIKKKIKQQ